MYSVKAPRVLQGAILGGKLIGATINGSHTLSYGRHVRNNPILHPNR